MPTLPIWKVTSVNKMLIKCSSKLFPVSSASLPMLFCFLLPAGIGKHLAIYKPFLISPFAYQMDLEWTKCKWESGSPGEFLGEAMWVLSSKWSPTSELCAPGRQWKFAMQGGENIHLLQRETSVCLCLGRFLTWREQELGDSPCAQPGHSPTETWIKSVWDSYLLLWAWCNHPYNITF